MKNTQPCFLGCTLGLWSNLHIYKLCYLHRLLRTPLRDRRGCITDDSVCSLLLSLLHPVGVGKCRRREQPGNPENTTPSSQNSSPNSSIRVWSMPENLWHSPLTRSTDLDDKDGNWHELLRHGLCDLSQVTSPLWALVVHLQPEDLTVSKDLSSFSVLRVYDSIKREPSRVVSRQGPCCQGVLLPIPSLCFDAEWSSVLGNV